MSKKIERVCFATLDPAQGAPHGSMVPARAQADVAPARAILSPKS
jgi:hypothetical protein